MRTVRRRIGVILGWMVLVSASPVNGQDWPQWRGPNRDGKVTGFTAPETWPKELTRKWSVSVGDGVATPALVGDKLYVFARQDGNEITRCLNATSGEEIWQDKYAAEAVRGPAARFAGPRSSPTVAEGKVVTLGVQGTLSCLAADTGKLVWRNDDFRGSVPRFATSSSPIVLDGICIAQFGSDRDGGIVAYDLATGNEKWKWTGDGAAYGSPVVITAGATQAIVTPTASKMVALAVANGNLLWQIPYTQGRYNAATPIVSGPSIVYAGPNRGTTAEEITIQGAKIASEKLWSNADNSVQFNTPVRREGLIFGISTANSLFCINAENGQTVWTAPLGASSGSQASQERGGRRGGRRGGGRGGYGSIVDAGSVLLALIPSGQLTVFEPGDQFKQLASYQVAESGAYAHPVASRNRLYIKDQDSVTLWTIE